MTFACVRRALPISMVLVAACGGDPDKLNTGGVGGTGGASSSSGAGAGGSGGAMVTASTGGSGGAGGTGGAAGCTPGATQPCYDGPAGTMNIGACKPGTQTCQADGTFGACEGEVLPAPESCATPIDDNCNGSANEGCVCTPGAVQTCYGGPPGTDGIGICKAGTQTCADDGLSLSACAGQVQPQIENCLSPEDEDCNGKAEACTGTGLWAKRYGDAQAQTASAVADHLGGAVITGALAGVADFGGGALTSAGMSDVFVASFDYMGAYVWAKRFGDAGVQSGVDVAADKLGNTLVIGDFAGTVDFGGGALASAGQTDVFVVKLDPMGGHAWSHRYGDAQAQTGGGGAVDAGVLVAGAFPGTVDFGTGALTSAGATDVLVAKLAP